MKKPTEPSPGVQLASALRAASESMELTGNCMHIVWPVKDRDAGEPEEDALPASAWEERFDICQIDAILHILDQLTKGLPGAMRRWLLRRASRLPGLHGRFAPYHRRLAFFADDSYEMIGMSEQWIVHENGVREKRW